MIPYVQRYLVFFMLTLFLAKAALPDGLPMPAGRLLLTRALTALFLAFALVVFTSAAAYWRRGRTSSASSVTRKEPSC